LFVVRLLKTVLPHGIVTQTHILCLSRKGGEKDLLGVAGFAVDVFIGKTYLKHQYLSF
jgi:hypothetical protein